MPQGIRFVIITGLSGAGKSEVIKYFEDLGYFCIDNLPSILLPKFAELCAQSEGRINKIALVIDIRGGSFFDETYESLENLEKNGFGYEVLYLEASEEILVRRFKESRRLHPLSLAGGVSEGIAAEKKRLEEIRGKATAIIDTSNLTVKDLREIVAEKFGDLVAEQKMLINVVSFGFKKGLPIDADLVFDVRFLPNPHYVDSLRELTGNNPEVANYVLKWPLAERFLAKLYDFIAFTVPQYVKEGKPGLVISIGCTGGQHRSVTLANKLGEFLKEQDYRVKVTHRDAK